MQTHKRVHEKNMTCSVSVVYIVYIELVHVSSCFNVPGPRCLSNCNALVPSLFMHVRIPHVSTV